MASDHPQQPGGPPGPYAGARAGQRPAGQILARGVLPARSEASLSAATLSLGTSQSVRRPPPRLSRGRLAQLGLGAFVVLSGGAALGVVGARRLLRPLPSSASGVGGAAQQRPFVSVVLRSLAPGARFRFEDGREVASPYVGLMPRAERPQMVWVEAPGYLPKKLQLTFVDDVTVDEIALVAMGSDASRAPRRGADHGVLSPRPAPKR